MMYRENGIEYSNLSEYVNKIFYVYKFLNVEEEVIYIGKTRDLKERMNAHFSGKGHLDEACYEEVEEIKFTSFTDKHEMDIYEMHCINSMRPKYNIKDKTGGKYRLNIPKAKWVTYNNSIKPKTLNDLAKMVAYYNYNGIGKDVDERRTADLIEEQFDTIEGQLNLLRYSEQYEKEKEIMRNLLGHNYKNEYYSELSVLREGDGPVEDVIESCLGALNNLLNT